MRMRLVVKIKPSGMAPMWIFFMECLLLLASSVISANKIKNSSKEEDCYIFLPNGENHDHFMFEVSTHNDLKRFNITGDPGCPVRILALGGGGYTRIGTGGGSGYVLYINTSSHISFALNFLLETIISLSSITIDISLAISSNL